MKYDIIVIGSGPGGYVAAIRAAQLGKKVAVVERAEAGGVCLNWGCIPTKALLKSAQVYNYCKSAEHYGLDFAGEVRPNLEKIVARSRGVAETMNKGVLFLLKKNNVELINGFAKLKGNGRIDVDGTEYEADHIILATGARPREMPFMPIDGEHVISSKQALVLPKLPETMIVVGSGAIGSEFAYFYAALGVKVTIVEYLPQNMPLEDEAVARRERRMLEPRRLDGRADLEAVEVAVVAVEGDLGHAFVRLVVVDVVEGERLVLLDVDRRVPVRLVVAKGVFLRQDGFGGLSDVAREVADEVIVGDAVVVDEGAQLVAAPAHVDVQARTAVVHLLVVGHQRVVDCRLEVVVEEPGLGVEHDAALGHQTGRQRKVVVGRDVEVVRDREVEAAGRAHAEGRHEEAGAALTAHGEGEPRGAEDGHAHEVQRGVRARCRLVVLVDLELVHLDEPGFVVALAGRDLGVVKDGRFTRDEADVLRAAADVARRIFVFGVRHVARARRDLEAHGRTREGGALARDARVANGLDFVGFLRVGDSVALEDGAGAADLRVAVKVELVFGVAFDAVGGHEARGVRVGRRAGRIERRHGFEGHHAACLSGRRNGGVGHGGQRDAYADRGLSGTRE